MRKNPLKLNYLQINPTPYHVTVIMGDFFTMRWSFNVVWLISFRCCWIVILVWIGLYSAFLGVNTTSFLFFFFWSSDGVASRSIFFSLYTHYIYLHIILDAILPQLHRFSTAIRINMVSLFKLGFWIQARLLDGLGAPYSMWVVSYFHLIFRKTLLLQVNSRISLRVVSYGLWIWWKFYF